MRKQIFLLSLAMILPATAPARPARQNALVINGQVLDADGRPAALCYAPTGAPVTAQTPEKSPPFGSSVKRPVAGGNGQAEARADSRPAAGAPPQAEEVVRVNTSVVNLDVLVTDAKN